MATERQRGGGIPSRFTPDRQRRLLELLADGYTLERARAEVRVSDTTVRRLLARADAGDADAVAFADEYRKHVRRGPRGSAHRLAALHRQGGLTRDDLLSLLEREALRGSVAAAFLLLTKHRRDAD